MSEVENITAFEGLSAEQNKELDMYKRTLVSVIDAGGYPQWKDMTDEERLEVINTIDRMVDESKLFEPRAFKLDKHTDEDGQLAMIAIPRVEIVNTETK